MSRHKWGAVISFFFLMVVQVSSWLLCASTGEAQERQFNAVIINSYHQGYEWSDREIEGLLERLRQVYPTFDPSIEHMDAKRYPGEDNVGRVKEFLAGKYPGKKIDLVLALDNPALEMILRYRSELFPGAPVVFGGINGYKPALIEGHEKITGVAELQDNTGTLKIALSVHPGCKEILVVHDYTSSGLAVRHEVEAAASIFQGRVNIRYTPLSTFGEILEQMKSLPPNGLGLILTFTTDSSGRSLPLPESTRILTSVTSVPVYAMHETRLGHGIVGGQLISGKEHGRRVGDIALRVLGGEEPSSIPVDTRSVSLPMFDYLQLDRFGIPVSSLPEGSRIINSREDFYEKYRSLVLGTVAIMGALTAIVILLATTIMRRRRAEEQLGAALTRYRTLFDSFPLGITTSDREGNIVEINHEAQRLLGVPEDEVLHWKISGPQWDIVRPDGTPMPADEFASVRALREQRLVENVEMGIVKSPDETTWISVTATPLPLPGYGVVITYSDIGDRKQAQETLKEREELFSNIVSQALDAITLVDNEGRFVEFNSSAHEGLGYTREEFAALRIVDIQAEHSPELIRQNMELVQVQGSLLFETRHRHRSGEIRDVHVSIKPLRIRNQEFFAAVWRDITERKRADEDLRFHKTILEETGHIAKVGGWRFDAVTGNGFWTDEVARIHDLDPFLPTSVEMALGYYVGESRTKIEAAVKDAVERGLPYDLELELISAKDVRKWVRTIGHPIQENGRVVAVQGSFQDISGHKRAEDVLRRSLEEKVALLKEVHHRVKNNLQIVTSLLGLQAGRSDNEQVVSVLEDMRNRVRSMALLHETLYRSGNLARINLALYLDDLCRQLLLSYRPTVGRVDMEYRIDDIDLPLEQAVPCGLIVSELVSNALKHGFPGVRRGRIVVALELAEEQVLILTVQDDGVGLPPDFDLVAGSTLGLQLVSGLARQLGGYMEMVASTGPGAAFRIAFPLPKDHELGEKL